MKLLCFILAATVSAMHGFCADQSRPQVNTNGTVFRQPFTLPLHIDKEHYYEQKFGEIPFVFKDDIYLFKGDSFGIDLDIANGLIRGIVYQPDTDKAAVTLRITQEVSDDGKATMLLVIKNRSNRKLFMDALMTVPSRKSVKKTSILPIEAGLGGYELWPLPIVQLVLRNIRLTEKPGTEQDGPANGSQPFRSE